MTENNSSNQNQAGLSAGLGTLVNVELVDRSGEIEHLSFHIVPDSSADFSNGFLGEGTPLARAIRGKSSGEFIPYSIGDLRQVRIISVEPAQAAPSEDIAAKRAETVQRAVQESDRTNALIFASSFSGKWGDYDPGGIEKWEKGEG